MKVIVTLLALAVAASALPTPFSGDSPEVANENSTFSTDGLTRGIGMATFGDGTTGGAGGAVWTVWDSWALRDAVSGNERRIVYVRGVINLDQLFVSSPGVRVDVGAHKSIIGGDRNAMIINGGLRVGNVHNVIIENIRFHNAISYANGERPDGNGGIHNIQNYDYSEIDAIEVTGSHHVWINHCEFADDPWPGIHGPNNLYRHDGQIDIVRGANFVTVSYCIFRNHEFVSLIGNGDNMAATDQGRLHTSLVGNWYMGRQRMPLCRFGRVHVLNNLYTNIAFYGIGVGHMCTLFVERNVFINTPRAWQAAGTTGNLRNEVNLLISGSAFIPGDFGSNVPWLPTQFYRYQPVPIGNVEAHVRTNAGIR